MAYTQTSGPGIMCLICGGLYKLGAIEFEVFEILERLVDD
jgi:hypothetical protein